MVHVVDASHPLAKQQIWSVQSIIEELMMEDTPQVVLLVSLLLVSLLLVSLLLSVQSIIEELMMEDTPQVGLS